MDLHVVGLGSLGSSLCLEIAKRSLALTIPLNLHIYDMDTVEERNLVCQEFLPEDSGLSKVEAITNRLKQYKLISVFPHEGKVDTSSLPELSEDSIILDCVDNLETRQLLWTLGASSGTPVLHLGMSTQGMGYAQWSFFFSDLQIDNFSLSPRNLSPRKAKELKDRVEDSPPPCELSSFRSLIFNTVISACNAIFIFLGKDISNLLEDKNCAGTLTSWFSTVDSWKNLGEENVKI